MHFVSLLILGLVSDLQSLLEELQGDITDIASAKRALLLITWMCDSNGEKYSLFDEHPEIFRVCINKYKF